MLSHPTLDQLKNLKLHGMARAFAELGDNPQAGELDHAQWLALRLDRETAERDDRRLTYRLRNAEPRATPMPPDRGHRLPHPQAPRQSPHPATGKRPVDRPQAEPDHHRSLRRR